MAEGPTAIMHPTPVEIKDPPVLEETSGAAFLPSLQALIDEHAAPISELRTVLGSTLPSEWDDLWLLRYIKSFPDPKKREQAIRKCIAYRQENAAMLADAAAERPMPKAELIAKYIVANYHPTRICPGSELEGTPIVAVRAALGNPVELMKVVSREELLDFFMWGKEATFRKCDIESRLRGKIIKRMELIHMEGSQLSTISYPYFKVIIESSKLSEFLYPQTLRKQVVINPPPFLHTLFRTLKPLMSQKLLDKQGVCPGRSATRTSASACPFASKHFDLSTLPSFLGGTCKCTALGGCINCRANEEDKPLVGGPEDPQALTVSARSTFDLHRVARAAGDTLIYSVQVLGKNLEVSAFVTPDEGALVELLEAKRYNSLDGVVEGEITVPVAGTVTLRFDNTYSKITSKKVQVTVYTRHIPAEEQ